LLFFLAFLTYGTPLNNPFVWDDRVLITGNPLMGRPLEWLLSPFFPRNDLSGLPALYYRPMHAFSLLLDQMLWKKASIGYH